MGKILATHTGSLIRPPELLSFLAAGERGESYDEAAYAEALRGAVNDVVKRQIDAGIDIVDDGEMGKASWITYLYERVSGLEARVMNVEGASMMPPSRDRQQFPGAYAALDALDEAAVRESNRAADSSEHDDEPAVEPGDRMGVHRADHLRPHRARPRHRQPPRRARRTRRRAGVHAGRRPRERLLAAQRALRRARRSSSTAWRTPCVRSTARSSIRGSSSRSTTPC